MRYLSCIHIVLTIALLACPAWAEIVHRYSFDSGTQDSIGNADGTLEGDAVVSDGSLILDGVDDWMSMPGDVIALNAYETITTELWFTSKAGGNTGYTMILYFGGNGRTESGASSNLGYHYLFMSAARGDNASRAAIQTRSLDSSPWTEEDAAAAGMEHDDGLMHHFVATLDSTHITFYIDGQFIGTKPLTSGNAISGISQAMAYLGKGGYSSDPEWAGSIHEFRIYNSALTAQDVANHYQWGPDMISPPLVDITESDGKTLLFKENPSQGDSYEIVLLQAPMDTVHITVMPPMGLSAGNGSGQSKTLTFTTENWAQPQTVQVHIADMGLSTSEAYFIQHAAQSNDPQYTIAVRAVEVTILEKSCGMWGYLETDYNLDCTINLEDFALLANLWMATDMPLNFPEFYMDWLQETLTYDSALYPRSIQVSDQPFFVNTDHVVNLIDEKIYGHFLEHIYHSVNGGLWGELVWNRSFEMTGAEGGVWTIETGEQGDELVQSSLSTDVRLVFGDASWQDYELTLEAQRDGGSEGFLIPFRYADGDNFYWLNLGGWNNATHAIEKEINGSRSTVAGTSVAGSIALGQWYTIRIRCQGNHFQVWLNEASNPNPLMDFTDSNNPHLAGRVGVGTWATGARFRNIQVKDLSNSTILFSGLPALPGTAFGADYWTLFGTGQGTMSTDALNDDYSVQIISDGSETGLVQDNFSFIPQLYQGSLWMKGTLTGGVRIELLGSNTVVGQAILAAPTEAWMEYPFQITPSEATDDGSLRITLLGAGTVLIDQVSLMGQDALDVGGYRPDLLAAVKGLRPPIIRWPGGCYASAYFWKDGIGRQHEHHKYPISLWDDQDTNSYGTDEFLRMCEAIGAEPLLVINTGLLNGTCGVGIPYKLTPEQYLQDALDWIEYCNGPADSPWGAKRAANGHPEPYNVKYWEIDNEVWSTSWGGGVNAYIDIVKTFAPAMRAADPGIQLIACGSGSYDQNWNRTLIDNCGTLFDYISTHHYEDASNFKAGPRSYEAFIETLGAYIANSANPNIRIYMSEWNAQSTDWRTGLYAGGLLNAFERTGDVFEIGGPALFLRHTSASGWDNAFINFDHSGWFPAPNYQVMQLWHDHYGPNCVETTGADINLNVVSTLSEDRQTLYLQIVNPDASSKSVEYEIDTSFVPASAYMLYYAPGSLSARNTLAEPNAVQLRAKIAGLSGQVLRFIMPGYSAGVVVVEMD